ncbi:hypothetical protein CJO84_22375 (plasmid) [Ralstonia solanacearum]|nr:hypothetical protein CJO84_22375 [Ralstonia solanacearum]
MTARNNRLFADAVLYRYRAAPLGTVVIFCTARRASINHLEPVQLAHPQRLSQRFVVGRGQAAYPSECAARRGEVGRT